MATNTISYAEKMSGELDKAVVNKTVTGFMVDNVMRAKFVGARTVKVPDIELQGLGDYNRDTGFSTGSITIANTALTLTRDRARSFQLDREDNDETGINNLAGSILGEFVKTQVVPEVDAYTISKIAAVAKGKSQIVGSGVAITDAVKKIYELFSEAVTKAQSATSFDTEMVCIVDPAVYTGMMSSPEFVRQINVGEFKKGEISTKVKMINDVAVLPASEICTWQAYEFAAAPSTKDPGGFTKTGNDRVGMLVMPKKAAMLIKKTETMRIFKPEQNLAADAYKFDYRIYYDAFVKKSLEKGIFLYGYTTA